MSNEEIVKEIQNGVSVTANLEQLYEKNLPLIKKIVRPYSAHEEMEDLLQQSYLALVSAVNHYQPEKGALFMTYAQYWIEANISRYLTNNGYIVKLPEYFRYKIYRYKRKVQEYQQVYNKIPSDLDMCQYMDLSIDEIEEIKLWMNRIASTDIVISEDNDITILDTISDKNDKIDSLIEEEYNKYLEKELWNIVERYNNRKEHNVLHKIFKENKTFAEVENETGLLPKEVRKLKDNGLRKLRSDKAMKEIREKFDILEASAYNTGIAAFKRNSYTSTVERLAIKKIDIENRYKGVVDGF